MSRIIKITFCIFCVIVSLLFFYLSIYWLGIFFIVLFFIWLLNLIVLYRIKNEKKPFEVFSHIRNVEYLIIGNIYDIRSIVPSNVKYSYILVPDCNERTAYELLRHTYSILKENYGTAVIVTKKNDTEDINDYSVFAVPFFHQVSINRLNLQWIKSKSHFPFIFSPIKGLKFMIKKTDKKIYDTECKNEDINSFCKERNISLIWKKTI